MNLFASKSYINFKRDWHALKIKNTNLIDMIYCWSIKPKNCNTIPNINQQRKLNGSGKNKQCNTKIIDDCKLPNCNLSCSNTKHD